MPCSKENQVPSGRRAVIVGGVRTPFAKAFAELASLDTIALGSVCVRELLARHTLAASDLGALVWGGVILPSYAPNVGREIVLELGLDPAIEAMTVTRACTSGLQAVVLAAAAIERGEIDVAIAGGSDSTSNVAVNLPPELVRGLMPLTTGRLRPRDVMQFVRRLWPPSRVLPKMPRIAERTTGEVMGESAEKMARINGISRREQDEFALRSHKRATRAIESGRLASEIIAVATEAGSVTRDGLVRSDTNLTKLAALRPVFAEDGTLTAGNSTALTDGAAAVLLMSEDKARALGQEALCHFASWAFVGVDPRDQLLIGPALAMPEALTRAGYDLSQMDFVDLHEAFAAQVLSVLKMLASRRFAQERLGRPNALGEIDPDRLNVHGGSLALGHPFAATGARMVVTMASELKRQNKRTALLGICAAGGLGAAAVLERG